MVRVDGFMIWVEDVAAPLAFYERAFDLTATQVDLDNGFALVRAGGVDLQFADEGGDERTAVVVRPNRAAPVAPPCQLAVVADDVEATYEQALGVRAEPVVPLTAKSRGQRVGYVRHLNGFLVERASPASW